jgi:hypothetical protein
MAYDAQADALTPALSDDEAVRRELASGPIVNLDGQGRAVAAERSIRSRTTGG